MIVPGETILCDKAIESTHGAFHIPIAAKHRPHDSSRQHLQAEWGNATVSPDSDCLFRFLRLLHRNDPYGSVLADIV